ncbi:putative Tyrosine-protein [Naja naja]|nr:putative Tyrosine-protein [Naja naja]
MHPGAEQSETACRVILQNSDNDYINASLVVNEEAQRTYILTQGPLPNTCCHFWLMIWQQKTKAVVMLNRIVEKDSVKCAQYWPTKQEEPMLFRETGFCVRLKSEDVKSYYTVRQLQLECIDTGESRVILHFHYTTWPDFGVPESPASFLNFLFKVRESGSLSSEHGPAVIHCSAGIGRSEDQAPSSECSPPHPTKLTAEKYNGNSMVLEEQEPGDVDPISPVQNDSDTNDDKALRKRLREDKKANTAQMVQQMKHRLSESERKRKRWLYWKPIVIKIGFGSVVFVIAYSSWKLYSQYMLM